MGADRVSSLECHCQDRGFDSEWNGKPLEGFVQGSDVP